MWVPNGSDILNGLAITVLRLVDLVANVNILTCLLFYVDQRNRPPPKKKKRKQEAQGLGALLDKMEDNDHIEMHNIII